jgi:hypothetical protein
MEAPKPEREVRAAQLLAIAACCMGLSTACGIGMRTPSYPLPPPPPPSSLRLSQYAFLFPPTTVNTRSMAQPIQVDTSGAAPNDPPAFETVLAPGSQFVVETVCRPAPPRAACTVKIVFAPRQTGMADEDLGLRPLDGSPSVWVRLRGQGVDAGAEPPAPR